jgi:catechol 2,3-dioxygenase-like lactoylglutathione lyase family enzyme
MTASIALVSVLVRDYDEAIAFFTDALRFRLVEDSPRPGGKRWVVVSPPDGGASLLLARAASEQQEGSIGRQAGGRVFLFLETSDFWADYKAMQARGVQFDEEPREEDYGVVAVFRDVCGNRWDLLQRRERPSNRTREPERDLS